MTNASITSTPISTVSITLTFSHSIYCLSGKRLLLHFFCLSGIRLLLHRQYVVLFLNLSAYSPRSTSTGTTPPPRPFRPPPNYVIRECFLNLLQFLFIPFLFPFIYSFSFFFVCTFFLIFSSFLRMDLIYNLYGLLSFLLFICLQVLLLCIFTFFFFPFCFLFLMILFSCYLSSDAIGTVAFQRPDSLFLCYLWHALWPPLLFTYNYPTPIWPP